MFGMGGYHLDWDARYGCVGNPGGYMFWYVRGMYCCGHCGGGGWYACDCGSCNCVALGVVVVQIVVGPCG